ncbi:hypothetical protein MTR67_035217 [Solanum verrucosum]|uniref:Uncharacterized protein n=1 Tax=Solanum verrucosum TaxID=315347 RepID=A0AAF0U9K9_SOLVR|nr:hypothetical protein MTR67_035217 [Solanum verrucosum]
MKVANGNKTRFWKDNWHEVGIMELVFPDIFNLVLHQQNTIAEMWTFDRWSLNFRRHFNDWEVQRVADFLSKLDQFPGVQAGEDHLWWQGNSKGIFKLIILNLKGIAWTMPDKITEALSSWEGTCSHAKDRIRWRIVPAGPRQGVSRKCTTVNSGFTFWKKIFLKAVDVFPDLNTMGFSTSVGAPVILGTIFG